jgi:hypothetical protein
MKYVAKLKDQPISSMTLANKEYKAHDDVIEVPDDHHEAHEAAKMIGLEHAPVEESPAKKPAKL